MQRIKSGLTALAVGIVLLAALDWAAAAATGQSLVLGKWNQADQTTTIKNVGSGPALDIRAKGPAIAVHNANRIKNLNADKLDGKDAADLAASNADRLRVRRHVPRRRLHPEPPGPAGGQLPGGVLRAVRGRRRQPRPAPTP